MKILVTGAAGFIGSHVCERLLARGDCVVGVDNFDPFYAREVKERNLKAAKGYEQFGFEELDLRKVDQVEALWEKNLDFDAVIHLAAKAGVRPSIADPLGYQYANVIATNHLLDAVSKQSIAPRFIFASSSSVYGNSPTVPFSEDDPVDLPISPYAQTKKSAELLCHTYHHLFNIPLTSLRFFTVYGPRQRPDLAIHKFVAKISAGETIDQYGDGSTSRDYTYISDIVTGILSALDTCEGYRIVNLGSDTPVSLAQMIETIEKACGQKAIVRVCEMQPGDVDRTWADVSKAKRELGYQPGVSFAQGIEEFVAWFRKVNLK